MVLQEHRGRCCPWCTIWNPIVILHLEALQVLGEPHLEPKDFQHKVGLVQQLLAGSAVFRPNQDFQQIVQVPLNPFAQHETVVAGELTRVVA